MNEILLAAERALAVGLLDRAEDLYQQAADADPGSSTAVVGLARVALERGDTSGSLRLAWRALAIKPADEAAGRLAARLEEVMTTRGDALPAREAIE